jgi:hypothetical protein
VRRKTHRLFYLWKYNETTSGDEFEYSAFERVELPFIMNFGIEYLENFIYIYYLPFRILENGDFECLGKGISYYYILKMGISNNTFYMKENQKILYYGRRQIFDYVCVNHKIIYLVDGYKIIEQDGANLRILYENNGEAISKFSCKNNHIIFLENHVFTPLKI